jgi:ABC-2 type transport system ATP-binding protein
MNAITVTDLTKRFDDLVAVDGVSFTVPEGELFGLLGPNGAGKTTIINMLITLLPPTSGTATVAGYDIQNERDAVRGHIGIVFQEPALDKDLTGYENLDFHAMMYGVPAEERKVRIRGVLELVELQDKADVLVQNYSGGMKRRLEIARGFIHHPKVLFLDEPTLGLDAQTRRKIWDYIRRMNKDEGVTIILTTHYMEEADYLSDRVAIMDHGKFVALDRPSTLKDTLGGDVITLELDGGNGELVRLLQAEPWVRRVTGHDSQVTLTVEKGDEKVPEVIAIANRHGIHVRSVNLRRPSLEDVFLHFTGTTMREREVSVSAARKEMITRRMRSR